MLIQEQGDEIIGEREFVNAALVCLRHCFVSGEHNIELAIFILIY